MQCVMKIREHSGDTEASMKCINKLFLIAVGIITIAYDEIADSIQRAMITIQEEREKLTENLIHPEP
jgi:hypothetical protein